MDPTALEIGPQAIRIMKMKEYGKNLIPAIHKEIPFNNEHNLADPKVTADEISSIVAILKKLKNEYKIKNVIATLPDQQSYIYRTEIPREAIADIASSIQFGLEENVPLKVSEVNFCYDISAVGDSSVDVVVNVFPKAVIQAYTDVIKKAGMLPISFVPESTAIASAVIKSGDAKPYLLVNIVKDHASVSIVSEGIVQYTSRIIIDGANLEALNESPEAKKLSQELNKTLIFWFPTNSSSGDPRKIQDALLVGEHSLTEGLVDYLENSLKIDVELGNVWSNCFSLDDYIPEIFKEKSLEYAGPIGLSVKSIKFK
jgi:Tfp pilus assembly PilM family ATPase